MKIYIWGMTIINLFIYLVLTVLALGLGWWFSPLIGLISIVAICTYSYKQLRMLNSI